MPRRHMRAALIRPVLAIVLTMVLGRPSHAQTSEIAGEPVSSAVAEGGVTPLPPSPPRLLDPETLFAQQPAGPPPTPRHTGIKALARHIVTDFAYLPSVENLYWAAAGGGLALAAHPFDDDVNRTLVGSSG